MATLSFENREPDGDDEKPIDPAFLRMQARLRRLVLIGGLTLGLGIFAVFGAILYRIMASDATVRPIKAGAEVPSVSLSALGLPAGARLISTALDGNAVAFTYETDGGTETIVVDARSGAVINRLRTVR
jgi:hypothetical protein